MLLPVSHFDKAKPILFSPIWRALTTGRSTTYNESRLGWRIRVRNNCACLTSPRAWQHLQPGSWGVWLSVSKLQPSSSLLCFRKGCQFSDHCHSAQNILTLQSPNENLKVERKNRMKRIGPLQISSLKSLVRSQKCLSSSGNVLGSLTVLSGARKVSHFSLSPDLGAF